MDPPGRLVIPGGAWITWVGAAVLTLAYGIPAAIWGRRKNRKRHTPIPDSAQWPPEVHQITTGEDWDAYWANWNDMTRATEARRQARLRAERQVDK